MRCARRYASRRASPRAGAARARPPRPRLRGGSERRTALRLPSSKWTCGGRETHAMSFAGREVYRGMTTDRTRWFALYVLCAASLMIVLDATIVNVALPSIKKDLGFTESSLAWVVNAYMLTYGGLLLLGGRLGDFFGARAAVHRRDRPLHARIARLRALHVAGNARGRARGAGPRRRGRLRGLALAHDGPLHEPADRAKAMGFFGFVAAGGGSIGVLLGGVLTDSLNWHWIFLVNVPIGARRRRALAASAACRRGGRRAGRSSTSPAQSPSPPR